MQQSPGLIMRHCAKVVTLLAAMAGMGLFLADSAPGSLRSEAGKTIRFVPNKAYQEECTSCHVAYLPGFLPVRSWKKLMGGLEEHFGENASLDAPVQAEITKFLLANAADTAKATVRSRKIAKLIGAKEAPIRITETPFWTRKHFSVKGYVWKREKVGSKARCESCHHDASKGLFSEYDVHVPK